MGKNEETSLVVVNNSIFGKIKRFFRNFFSTNNYEANYYEEDENELVEEQKSVTDKDETVEVRKSKLFNYDDPQNYYDACNNENKDGEAVINMDDRNENCISDNCYNVSRYFDEDNDNQQTGANITMQQSNDNDEYEVKDEIQQKLINYYASIKKIMK